jgi:hypothetical protein
VWFHLSGYVNSQNYRTWRTENPHNFTESPLHPKNRRVVCHFGRRIIGSLFFETSINAEAYQELTRQYILLLKLDEHNCCFQQDSATDLTAASAMVILHQFFGENVISKGIWPPRFPDLTSPDFLLWSYLKGTLYRSNPRDLKQLKMNITHAIEEVNAGTLRKVARNMVKRVDKCIEMNGHHFQHLL